MSELEPEAKWLGLSKLFSFAWRNTAHKQIRKQKYSWAIEVKEKEMSDSKCQEVSFESAPGT
jgi:hypothetical protein